MKIYLKLFLFFPILLFSNFIFAQKISGTVKDFSTNKPIPFVNIIHLNSQKGVVSDINGAFTINTKINDSIRFSAVGYQPKIRIISNYNTINILLIPLSYTIQEIQVKAEDEVPLRYKSEVFPDGEPKIGHAIVNPLSFWYYKLSKKEKSKKKYRDLMDYERRMAKVMKIYTKELVAEFSGLTGEKLDNCYRYCNANIELEEFDTEFSIKYKLLLLLTDYKKLENTGTK